MLAGSFVDEKAVAGVVDNVKEKMGVVGRKDEKVIKSARKRKGKNR